MLPGDGAPAALTPVSGDRQRGTIGEPLGRPLVVRATDGAGRPVAELPIVFRFARNVPGAAVVPDTVHTDAQGTAAAEVVLGTVPGAQAVEARVALPALSRVRARFLLTAVEPARPPDDDGQDDGDDDGQGGEGDDDDDEGDDDEDDDRGGNGRDRERKDKKDRRGGG
ncbi:MAG TPA: Ig-like domain-containing protein [Gemmatimonadales bacterium]|nr:Ig-like domain-containing protein [Gemmatimonadales bacterium]